RPALQHRERELLAAHETVWRAELHRPVPGFEWGPLKPAQVCLGRAGPRWAWQSWGSGAGANLHRVGGPPSWVQSAGYPDCRECGSKMAFLLQLDSNLPLAEEDRDWLWGSGGMGYGFWCDGCRVSAWLWQCT